MARTYMQLLDQSLQNKFLQRQEAWTESIAVGSKEFISKTKRTLASKATGMDDHERNVMFEVRESSVSYSARFDPKKYVLRPEKYLFMEHKC